MSNWQLILLFWVASGRLIELVIAKRNAIWLKRRGGYEVGRKHYPLFVLLHMFFFVGIWVEATEAPAWWWIPFLFFVMTQFLRIWSMLSLGRFWNTRIWVVPGHQPKRIGPYRWIRHPNYLVVIIELCLFPLIYQAYLTAILISLLNAYLLLRIRIPAEERALSQVTPYEQFMEEKHRWLPNWRMR